MEKQLKSHGAWIGKWTFILAATGSAVGLGNIWGFPYKAGTNGGGAFVLIYLLCIVIIGVPISTVGRSRKNIIKDAENWIETTCAKLPSDISAS